MAAEPRILYVDDEPDLLDTVGELLRLSGYAVDTAGSADAGVRALEQQRYDLVITDLLMPPGDDGVTMLRRAAAHLHGAATCVMTANPDLVPPTDAIVLAKPMDVEVFLAAVHRALAPHRQALLARAVEETRVAAAAAAKLELVLYVSAASAASLKASRNMLRLLAAYPHGAIAFRIRDLAKEPIAAGEDDRITFTPTLVARRPGPRAWIVGDLENIKPVRELIAAAGVTPK